MRQYTIMMDDRTCDLLVDEAISKVIREWEDDGSVRFQDSIARLESVADALSRQRVGTELPAPDDQVTGDPEGLSLVAQVMHAAAVSQALIDSLQRDNDRLQALTYLIQGRVHDLCDGEWMPTTRAILAALFPSREEVELRAQVIRQGRGDS